MAGKKTQLVELTDWAKRSMQERPIEADIVNRIFTHLALDGNPIVSVFDGEQMVPVSQREEVLNLVFNLDEVRLHTHKGGYIYLVMGQDWDILTDYTMSLDPVLTEINKWIAESA